MKKKLIEIPTELHNKVAALALQNGRSVNKQIVFMLKQAASTKAILLIISTMLIFGSGCTSKAHWYSSGSKYQTGAWCTQNQVKKTKHASTKRLKKKYQSGKW